MRSALHNTVIEAIIMVTLLFWPQTKSESQNSITIHGIIDTVPIINKDSIAILDSLYYNQLIKVDKTSRDLLKNALPKLTKADKELDKKLVKLEAFINKKEEEKVSDTAVIIADSVKIKRTFWQKIKSIFKSKNKQ